MTTFDDRERSYEAKFARDAELNFKAEARRNRLLGEWAAGVLGKTGDEARAYALTVVTSDFAEPGDEAAMRQVLARTHPDLTALRLQPVAGAAR